LYAFCRQKLDGAQGKVEELARRVEQARPEPQPKPQAPRPAPVRPWPTRPRPNGACTRLGGTRPGVRHRCDVTTRWHPKTLEIGAVRPEPAGADVSTAAPTWCQTQRGATAPNGSDACPEPQS